MKYTSLGQMNVGDKVILTDGELEIIRYIGHRDNSDSGHAIFVDGLARWYDNEIDWEATNKLYPQEDLPTQDCDNEIKFKITNILSERNMNSDTIYKFVVIIPNSDEQSLEEYDVSINKRYPIDKTSLKPSMLARYNSIQEAKERERNQIKIGDIL
jgi:hypothetical protein